jgi:raffinose/stachyose/melibiose transport system permease protein
MAIDARSAVRTLGPDTNVVNGRPPRKSRAPRAARGMASAVFALLLVCVEIYPLVWIFLSALKTQNEFLTKPLWSLPTSLHWSNFSEAWTRGNLSTDVRNSLIVTVSALLMTLVLGVLAAFALEVMVWRGRGTVLLAIVAGFMIPGQMILLPLFTVYFKLHLTNSLWPLVITYTGTGLPLTIFLMVAYFRAIPRELFEAALIDGAGVFRAFFYVGLPLIRNAIFTVALVQFFHIWNDLLIAVTFVSRRELNTIQVGLLNFNGEYGEVAYGPLFAAITITVFGTLALYLTLNQQIMKGLTAGSVKS